MNSILKCSQRNGRARGVFWRGNDVVLQNVSLHFVGFFQNGGESMRGHYEEEQCADAGCRA